MGGKGTGGGGASTGGGGASTGAGAAAANIRASLDRGTHLLAVMRSAAARGAFPEHSISPFAAITSRTHSNKRH